MWIIFISNFIYTVFFIVIHVYYSSYFSYFWGFGAFLGVGAWVGRFMGQRWSFRGFLAPLALQFSWIMYRIFWFLLKFLEHNPVWRLLHQGRCYFEFNFPLFLLILIWSLICLRLLWMARLHNNWPAWFAKLDGHCASSDSWPGLDTHPNRPIFQFPINWTRPLFTFRWFHNLSGISLGCRLIRFISRKILGRPWGL